MVVRNNLRIPTMLVALCAMVIAAPRILPAQQSIASPLVSTQASSASIAWQPLVSFAGASLRVTGPDGFVLERQLQTDAPLEVSLADLGENVADGLYHYELVLAPVLSNEQRAALEHQRVVDGSTAGENGGNTSVSRTVAGIFRVVNGAIEVPHQNAVEPLPKSAAQASTMVAGSGAMTSAASPDQVIADDLIVQGSECVGFDCVNNESFGFDTLRLKENNTRIKFEDTSTSSGFPTTDWQLTANDSNSGGASYFSIDDITDGKTPFKVSANAPTGSIYVAPNGYVGFGTTAPAVKLQETKGDTPTLRLEQNNSSGFTAQTWDVAGNETNFFIRDVTNGSKLPFKIIPGAPTNSLVIGSNGNVGLGTNNTPDANLQIRAATGTDTLLHVDRSASPGGDLAVIDGGALQVLRQDDASANLRLTAGSSSTKSWLFQANPTNYTLGIRDETASNSPVLIYGGGSGGTLTVRNGRVGIGTTNPQGTLDVNGPIYLRGSVLHADYVFEPSYKLQSIADHAKYMWKHRHLPAIGGMKKDAEGREVVNLGGQQRGIVQELEEAHIYISELNQKDIQLGQELASTKAQLEAEHRATEATRAALAAVQQELAALKKQMEKP